MSNTININTINTLVRCRYATSGCPDLVVKGTMIEKDHYECCNYRPLKCIYEDCELNGGQEQEQGLIPHHSFLPHIINQHYGRINFGNLLVTNLAVKSEDFTKNQIWTPKWMCAYDSNFFFSVSHQNGQGWFAWLWLLTGPDYEALKFKAKVTFFKGMRNERQVIPVHSIRVPRNEIEMDKMCFFASDKVVKRISDIGKNLVTDFGVQVRIIAKNPIEFEEQKGIDQIETNNNKNLDSENNISPISATTTTTTSDSDSSTDSDSDSDQDSDDESNQISSTLSIKDFF